MTTCKPASGITTGGIRRTVLWLALPVLGEQLLHSFVALVDTFLAGQISKEATAAVGFASYVEWLASMLFALVATGTTALVARSIGARNDTEANHFTNQSMSLSVLSGIGFSALIFLLAPSFARLQDMTGETYRITVMYLRLDSLALTFTSLTLVGSAALRGAGDTRTPLKIFALVNVFNALLSAALVFGVGPFPTMGVLGIVLGTVAARVLGGLIMIGVLIRRPGPLRLHWSALPLRREITNRIFRIGLPAAADGAVMWTGQFLFLMVVARLGTGETQIAYYAAHMIGVRLEALVYLPATAWSIAAATMIGQNLGAEKPVRARRSGQEAALQCGLLALLVAVGFFFGARLLFALMHHDTLVHEVGVGPFRILAWFQPLLAICIVFTGALRGAGDTRFPLLINFVGVTLLRLPLAWWLGVVLGWGLYGAWLAMCADFTLRAALAAARFARGRWIKVVV
ncbi:MAG TPA: MATE family efflux transporter [Phycisphaerae bacterium]|nr:MATE family efflux transporter [Phycisphaerae bacterium]